MKTESKQHPKIQRSKKEKMIFFPDNIITVQKETESGVEDFYSYDIVRIPDTNQQIEDYESFKKENYAELRKNAYGSWQGQFEMMREQGFDAWLSHCNNVRKEFENVR